MRLTWSAFALADRDDIFTHIEAENPRAAVAVDEHIEQAVLRLVEFPDSGRPGRVPGTRELVIHRTPPMSSLRIVFGFCAYSMERRCGLMSSDPIRPATKTA